MYRHATHADCTHCGIPIAIDNAEYDLGGQMVCTPCGARLRVDSALVRWRNNRDGDNRDVPFILLLMVPAMLLLMLLQ